MSRSLLLLFLFSVSCARQPQPVTEQPAGKPVGEIEIRTDNAKPVTLGGGMSAAVKTQETKPLVMTSLVPPMGLQARSDVPAPSQRKSVPFQGAYVEERGPCNGRPIAGFIGSGADRTPICGADEPTYSRSASGRSTTSLDANGKPRRTYNYPNNTPQNYDRYRRPRY